jgi:hypothetical protein
MIKLKRWTDGDLITASDWNELVDVVERVDQKAEEPTGLIAATAAAGLALAGSSRRLSRRQLFGLGRRAAPLD